MNWPPKCDECGKFIPWAKAKIERIYYGAPQYDCDDIVYGKCKKCETP